MEPTNLDLAAFDPASFILDCRGRSLDCRPGTENGAQVVGILNVTPDSFSDGGLFTDLDAAWRHAQAMTEAGATIIDVGGESTRPRGSVYGAGAVAVDEAEERQRVLPVIEAIATRLPQALISIDTYKPEVARAALEAGAHVVNDVTGLRYTTETAHVAAAYGAPLIVMHSLGRPGEMPHERRYDDVVRDVTDALAQAVEAAEHAGVRHVVVDPGFGFGKQLRENLRLLNAIPTLLSLGRPVMVGISRKSTIGALLSRDGTAVAPGERLYGTLGATAVAVQRGASLVRTHDVRPTAEMLHTMAATMLAHA